MRREKSKLPTPLRARLIVGRGGAERPGCGAAAERGGQLLGPGLVAADDLDRVPAGECPAASTPAMFPRPMMLILLMVRLLSGAE
ncbi:hypothetical protein [Pseudonocardia kunmingensis]|uniref:hypothetical protein n=1 Tax=Pseudonocardia kunmingensis TaxID=630975 RepID=UPI001B86635F|nr:hypothetical protein [Pseudonocardia kunmingensis]